MENLLLGTNQLPLYVIVQSNYNNGQTSESGATSHESIDPGREKKTLISLTYI